MCELMRNAIQSRCALRSNHNQCNLLGSTGAGISVFYIAVFMIIYSKVCLTVLSVEALTGEEFLIELIGKYCIGQKLGRFLRKWQRRQGRNGRDNFLFARAVFYGHGERILIIRIRMVQRN